MLTVHHLRVSQSERIVWLCEELGVEYKLVNHTRREDTKMSPDSLKNVPGNDLGLAPFIEDGDVKLGETGAIAQYILTKYGGGKLVLPPEHRDYASFLFWFWWGCSGLMPGTALEIFRQASGMADDSPIGGLVKARFERLYAFLEGRCKESKWLAGDEFTAAECTVLFCVTSNRYFLPVDLSPFPNLVRWINDCAARDGYKKAMEKCDPDLDLAVDVKGPQKSLLGS